MAISYAHSSMQLIFIILLMLTANSCGTETNPSIADSSKKTADSIEPDISEITLESILSRIDSAKFREGELLIKFRPGRISASAPEAHKATGAALLKRHSFLDVDHVRLPGGFAVKDAVVHYMKNPSVEYAEPNYLRSHRSRIPNDPDFNRQWGLRNTGTFPPGAKAGADIRAAEAWDISVGTGKIIIAVMDTGVDYNHPDLNQNIWTNPGESCTDGVDNDGNGFINDCLGWNFVDKNNAPLDNSGHGTHVAGIIGALGNNGTGVAGVMWNVKLLPLKILNAEGTGTIADEIAAINYAITMKNRGFNIKAINASFTGGSFSNTEFSAISAANNAGLLLTAAAGNTSEEGVRINNDVTPQYPASYNLPNIISVAATDHKDNLASFSNIGPASVHVAAPGVHILSTIPSDYALSSGTSVSTPFVSGVAGLLWTAYPEFTNVQVRGSILRYVDVLGSLQGQIATGGRINSFRAVSSLLTPENLTASVTSSGGITLEWTDSATGEDEYRVERRTGDVSFSQIGTPGPDSTSFTDASVSANTTYTYRVSAVNNIAGSGFSNEASATTTDLVPPPASPQPRRSSGGGGGCSVAKEQTESGSAADMLITFAPLLAIVAVKYILRKRG